VCARSMVRDLYEPHEGVRVLSFGMSGLGVIACAGPLIGAALSQLDLGASVSLSGWRLALLILSTFGAGTLAYVLWFTEESIRQRQPTATQIGPMVRNWRQIAVNPTFISYVCLTAGTYAGLYTFLSTSSFVLIEGLGMSRLGYSAVLSSGALTYLAGTFGCRIWLARFGIRGAVKRGAFITLIGATLMAGLSLAGVHSIWAIIVPQLIYAAGHGVHQSCGQAGVVGPFPTKAGAASALSGFILSATAFSMGQWLGQHMDRTGSSVYPLTLSMGAWGVFTALVGWTLVQRYGDPHTPAFDGAMK
jgi:DHA1 family bicyclomycin/chloramphenicol resistance-like MFS transporter